MFAIGACQTQGEIDAGLGDGVYFGMIVNEVAASAVLAGEILAEMFAFLGLVLHVRLVVLQQFVAAVCELASVLIGTHS